MCIEKLPLTLWLAMAPKPLPFSLSSMHQIRFVSPQRRPLLAVAAVAVSQPRSPQHGPQLAVRGLQTSSGRLLLL
jgi:hypothetical protein